MVCRDWEFTLFRLMRPQLIMLKKDRLMSLIDTLDDDPGVLHTNLSLLPPLIADDPGDTTSNGSIAEPRIPPLTRRRDSYVDPNELNPLPPVVLSELFQLTDTLWSRFPLTHPDIRAREIMAEKSVMFTYADGVPEKELNIIDVEALVRNGIDETQVVVMPDGPDSEDEAGTRPDDMPKPNGQRGRQLNRPIIGKAAMTFAVVALAIGVLWYHNRRPGALKAYLALRLFPSWRRQLDMHRVWRRIGGSTNLGGESGFGRWKQIFREMTGC
jgi:hypothetical protein